MQKVNKIRNYSLFDSQDDFDEYVFHWSEDLMLEQIHGYISSQRRHFYRICTYTSRQLSVKRNHSVKTQRISLVEVGRGN